MKEKTLVIMAAGMGSRFGGLKQIEPIGPNGEFIIDYSIYDAVKAGFNKVVIIIKKENYDLFRETVGKRIEDKITVEYAYQEMDNIPAEFVVPEDRTKPWGTGHALLSAKDAVHTDFAVINSDDFYGYDAFARLAEFLDTNTSDNVYGNVVYKIINTLTSKERLKRGVCHINELGEMDRLTESAIDQIEGSIIATPLSGDPSFVIGPDRLVAVNCFAFTYNFFDYLEEYFVRFLKENENDLSSCEYLIPEVVNQLILSNKVTVRVLPTTATWQGITYKEDKEQVVNFIAQLVENGEYPVNLWEK